MKSALVSLGAYAVVLLAATCKAVAAVFAQRYLVPFHGISTIGWFLVLGDPQFVTGV